MSINFLGIAVMFLVLIGILWKMPNKNRRFAFYNLWAFGFLVVLTLNYNDLSIYKLIYGLPGFTSIRAIARIILVMMWPLAVFLAIVIDQLISGSSATALSKITTYLCIFLMIMESVLFTQPAYSKNNALGRISDLRSQLPQNINKESILFVAANRDEPWWSTEIDAMLLGQELGLSVLNGYSGNFPPGYGPAFSCNQLKKRISSYLRFSNQTLTKNDYLDISRRVVPIGFSDCSSDVLKSPSENFNP
jgi:hypothetical protein